MKTNYKTTTIILKPRTVSEYNNLLPNLFSWLKRRKINAQFLISDQGRIERIFKGKKISSINFIEGHKVFKESDFIISLGGDGTLIGISKFATTIKTPIFGVNLGRLGFITEFRKNNFYDYLELFLKDQLQESKTYLYSATLYKNDKQVERQFFINDVVFTKLLISRMFTVQVESNEGQVFNLSGDGIIVSSPIGSTAYSLAAGGPIVHPQVRAMILTPICPHGLTNRPLVLPDSQTIKILSKEKESIQVTLDGQRSYSVSDRDYVIVKREKRFMSLIKNPDKNYFDTLREKFFHGRREGQR